MRLVTLGGIAALASVAVALACSDQPSAPRSAGLAEGAMVRIHGAGTFTVHTANGSQVRSLPAWSASGTVKNGIAHEDGAARALGVLGISNGSFASAATDGKHRTATFTDPSGARHDVVWINSPDGSPPRKVAHFVDGKLVMVTDYTWSATARGWTIASIGHTTYVDGKPAAELRENSSGATEVAARAAAPVLRRLALLAMSATAPADANAQILGGQCRAEWLAYVAATAALSAALQALTANPLNPILIAAAIAAAANASLAEFRLWLCQQNHENSGGSGGGGGKTDTTPLACQIDPQSAGCDGNPVETL